MKTKHRHQNRNSDWVSRHATNRGNIPRCTSCGVDLYPDWDDKLERTIWICTNPNCKTVRIKLLTDK
jgi:hypothetical protein